MLRSIAFLVVVLATFSALAQGPVLLAGIDTEFGERPADESHGSIDLWAGILQNAILNHVTNGGTGILVIGGGKSDDDEVTRFWDQIGAKLGQPVSYAKGFAILFTPFDSYAMIAVANAEFGSGHLRVLELQSLNLRQNAVTAYLCNGGGLFASANNHNDAFGYLSGVHPVEQDDHKYKTVTATPLGAQLGFGTYPDMGPWHTVFTSYPSYLEVYATAPDGRAAAIGTPRINDLAPVFSLQKSSYCLGEPIIADTSGTRGELDHFWSIQESDASWNRFGPELMKWMGGAAGPIDLAALARDEGLPFQCDRYYRVKLAVSGFCTSWAETTQLIYVSCARVDAGPDQCCDDYLVLGNTKEDGNVSWEWSPAEDIDDPGKRQTILRLKSGYAGVKSFSVTGTNKFGCRSSDTVNIYCRRPEVSITPSRNCCDATLVASGPPVQKLAWDDGTTSPVRVVTTPGVKTVEVSSPCGKASASFEVANDWFLRGPFPTLIALDWFSPNGDGDRDVFRIEHLGIGSGEAPAYNATYYELWIRDRFGGEHRVAQSDSNSCGRFWNGQIQWDGRINGNLVQQDTYSWRLVLRNCDGIEITAQKVRKKKFECTETSCFLWIFNCHCVRGHYTEYDETEISHKVTVIR